jgi:hypothetical protein
VSELNRAAIRNFLKPIAGGRHLLSFRLSRNPPITQLSQITRESTLSTTVSARGDWPSPRRGGE